MKPVVRALLTILAVAVPAAATKPKPPKAAVTPPPATSRASRAPLSPKHKAWLEDEAGAIISDYEREAFVSLADDKARAAFIGGFWAARDPTPGTPQNEFREQHLRRIAEANRLFGQGKARPGAKSPRGRMYILLGPPHDRQNFSIDRSLYPSELWLYEAPAGQGLPAYFYLLFYEKSGAGDFELYNPASDGPEALIGGYRDVAPSRSEALSKLYDASPELRNAAVNLIPGSSTDLDSSGNSAANMALLGKLADLPNQLGIDTSYIGRAAAGADVTTEWSLATLKLKSVFIPVRAEQGGSFLMYAFEIAPENLTLGQNGDSYYGVLEVVGRVIAKGGTPVVQVDRRVEIKLSREELDRVKRLPFAYQDLLPLVPGSFEVHLVVRNTLTRETALVTAAVEMPQPAPRRTELATLFLASRAVPAKPSGGLRPFRFAGYDLYPVFDATVGAASELVLVYQIAYDIHERKFGDPFKVHYVVRKGADELLGGFGRLTANPAFDGGWLTGVEKLKVQTLAPGDYKIELSVEAADGTSAARSLTFHAVAGETPPQPWVYVARTPSIATLELARGEAYAALGNRAGAREALGSALAAEPRAAEPRLRLAEIEMRDSAFERVIAALKPLALGKDDNLLVLLYLGLASHKQGAYADAVGYLERALVLAPGSTRVLNALAEAALRAGDKSRARRSIVRSLGLDANQPEAQSFLRQLPE